MQRERMGLTIWENAPDGKIVKPDVIIAKNYLKQVELEDMVLKTEDIHPPKTGISVHFSGSLV